MGWRVRALWRFGTIAFPLFGDRTVRFGAVNAAGFCSGHNTYLQFQVTGGSVNLRVHGRMGEDGARCDYPRRGLPRPTCSQRRIGPVRGPSSSAKAQEQGR